MYRFRSAITPSQKMHMHQDQMPEKLLLVFQTWIALFFEL